MKAEVQVTGLSHDGQGVARLGSHVLFINGALPGESIRARLTYKAKRHWIAEMEELLQASSDRQKPPCILADNCGGCSLQHFSDAGQGHWKQQKVVDALERIAHLNHPVNPLLSCEPSLGYRNRAIIPLERLEDGRLKAGYYRPGSHQIVNMNHCPVLDPRIDALIEPLKADLEASEWPVDRDCKESGGLRHLALRVGVNTPQAERVVPLLLEALASLPPGVMVDGYCGIGTYSLPVAASGWQVHGIELSSEAVKQAKANAEANNLSHLATYEAGVVSRCLPEHLIHCDVLFLDPPRKGLDSFVVDAILAQPPQTLIYLSCDPATLARDLGQFTASAYRLEQIQPIDFFPQTIHVETLAVLRRN